MYIFSFIRGNSVNNKDYIKIYVHVCYFYLLREERVLLSTREFIKCGRHEINVLSSRARRWLTFMQHCRERNFPTQFCTRV